MPYVDREATIVLASAIQPEIRPDEIGESERMLSQGYSVSVVYKKLLQIKGTGLAGALLQAFQPMRHGRLRR